MSYLDLKCPLAFEFSVLDQDEILKSSVCSVKNERIYDMTYLQPSFEGVNDPRMGTMDRDQLCFTCKGTQVDCPGHFGHIELARPVFHGGFLECIRKVLKCVCFNCSRLLYPRACEKEEVEAVRKVRNGKARFGMILRGAERCRVCEV